MRAAHRVAVAGLAVAGLLAAWVTSRVAAGAAAPAPGGWNLVFSDNFTGPAGSPVNVTVQVSDGQATTSQSWTLSWNTKFPVNYPPAITSQPPLTALVGTAYSYLQEFLPEDRRLPVRPGPV